MHFLLEVERMNVQDFSTEISSCLAVVREWKTRQLSSAQSGVCSEPLESDSTKTEKKFRHQRASCPHLVITTCMTCPMPTFPTVHPGGDERRLQPEQQQAAQHPEARHAHGGDRLRLQLPGERSPPPRRWVQAGHLLPWFSSDPQKYQSDILTSFCNWHVQCIQYFTSQEPGETAQLVCWVKPVLWETACQLLLRDHLCRLSSSDGNSPGWWTLTRLN